MRLKILDIENFGVYRDKRIEFPSNGLQVVYGSNEAGKTTLLQLIRDLLFGFPHVSEYATMADGREVAAQCLLTLANGKDLNIRRRKGRKNTVHGAFCESGEVIDEQRWDQLLEGASPDLFNNVFAFSLAELTNGQESLSHAKLSEALFGGGVGGLRRFQNLKAAVSEEADSLYNPRGRNPRINQLLREIGDQHRRVRDDVFLPSRFEQLQSDLEEAEAERDRYRKQIATLRRDQERVRRLRQSQTLSREFLEAQRECQELEHVTTLPEGSHEKLERLTATLEQLQADLVEDQFKLDALREPAAEPRSAAGADIEAPSTGESSGKATRAETAEDTAGESTSPNHGQPNQRQLNRWLDAAAELHQRVDQILAYRRDIPRRRSEREALLNEVQRMIRQWIPDGDWQTLESLPLRRTDAELCRGWATSGNQLEVRLEALRTQVQDIDIELAALAAEDGDEPAAVADLRPLLEAGEKYLRESATLDELDEEFLRLSDQLDACFRSLAADLTQEAEAGTSVLDAPPTDPELVAGVTRLWEQLTPPSLSEADQMAARWQVHEQAISEAKQNCQHWREETQRLAAESDLLREQQALPDVEQLPQRRAARDAMLTALLKDLRETTPESLRAVLQQLADDERETDRLVDRILEQSGELAQWQRLQQERHRASQKLDEAATALERAEMEFGQLSQQWHRRCAQCGLNRISPAAVAEWRRHWDRGQELFLRWKDVGRRRAVAEQAAQQHQSAWSEGLAGQPLTDSSVRELELRIAQLQQREIQRQTEAKRQRELLVKRSEFLSQVEQLTAEQQRVQAEWIRWRDEAQLPSEWTPTLAAQVATEVATLQSQVERGQDLQRRCEEMEGGIRQFVADVEQLTNEIAELLPEESDVPLDLVKKRVAEDREAEAARELFRWLDDLRDRTQQKRARHDQYSELAKEVAAKRARREHVESQLNALYRAAGVTDETTYRERLALSLQRRDAEQRLHHLEEKLAVLAGNESTEVWREQCFAANEDELAARDAELSETLSDAENAVEACLRRITLLQQQMEDAANNTTALEGTQRLEALRAELAGQVDRWAPVVLAQELMQRALRRFEQEHQPAMLARVAQLLSQMTEGRYLQVTRRFDEGQSLVVQRDDGHYLLPEQLSTGAREQLYLAIRLAFVLHYCDRHEPLPIVMDDVLVNFDDQRAHATIEVLESLPAEVQVILLTCHQRTLNMCLSSCADAQPIYLSRAGQDAGERGKPERPSRRRRRAAPSAGQGTFFDVEGQS